LVCSQIHFETRDVQPAKRKIDSQVGEISLIYWVKNSTPPHKNACVVSESYLFWSKEAKSINLSTPADSRLYGTVLYLFASLLDFS